MMQRRLAAVLAADVVGYSRLMGVDEVGTLRSLKSHRRELVDLGIAEHRGRIVKTTGDGMLVEFASVVDAVACAVNIQREMLTRNAAVQDDRQIVFRIGINVGDIIIDSGDIFGDGVNIAARLEACEPGGVCISRAANEQIRDKLSLGFADLGEVAALPFEVAFDELEIHFCQTEDGVQRAYAKTGKGPALVRTGNWMTHLEFDFESPIWRRLYRELSRDHESL